MVLETDRLIIREFTYDDFDDLKEVIGDKENMKYYPYEFDDNMVRNWIFRNKERYDIFGFGVGALVLKETGKVIGDCGVSMQSINRVNKPEIGYHINRKYHRMGYAKEAAIAYVNWVFANTPFKMIYSYMTEENEPSYKTAEALGLKFVEEYNEPGEGVHKVYAISREEWNKLHNDTKE